MRLCLQIYNYIQSRYYRAPEILLGCSYGKEIECAALVHFSFLTSVLFTARGDRSVWSAACVFVEMLTGKPLFAGRNACEQLLRHIELLGMPPEGDCLTRPLAHQMRCRHDREVQKAGQVFYKDDSL